MTVPKLKLNSGKFIFHQQLYDILQVNFLKIRVSKFTILDVFIKKHHTHETEKIFITY
jgi:hypothetical protein